MSTFKAKGHQRPRAPKPYETKKTVVSRVKDWFTPSSWWTTLGYETDPDSATLNPRDTSQIHPSDSSQSSYMSIRNGRSAEPSLLGTETSSLPQFRNDGNIPQLSSPATKLIAEPSEQLVQSTPAVGSESHTRTGMASSHGGMAQEDHSMEDDSESSWVAEDDSQVDNWAISGRNPAGGVSIERRLSPIVKEEGQMSKSSLTGKVDSRPSHFLPREVAGTRLEHASYPPTSARVGLTVSEHVVERMKNPAYRMLSKVSERTPAPGSIFSDRITSSASVFSHKLYSTQPVTTSTPQSSPILGSDVEAMDNSTVRNHPQSVALPPTELPRPQDHRQHPPLSHTDTPRPPATQPYFQSSTPGPAFSVAAFTSPSRLYTNISLSRSPFQSPFYSGRTSFGGMASGQRLRAKRPRTDSSPPRLPLIRHTVKARPAGGSDQLAVSSHTAKKILEMLEGLSSPLADARKLPLRGGGPYDVQRPAKRWRSDQSSSSVLSPPPVTPLLTPSHTHISSKHAPVIVPNERTLSLQHDARAEGTNLVLPQQPGRREGTMATSLSQGKSAISSLPSGGPSPQGLLRPRGTTATSRESSVSHVPTGGLQFGTSPSVSQASPLRNITFTTPPLKQMSPASTPPQSSSEGGHASVPKTSSSGVFTPVFHASLPQGGGKMRSHRSPRHVSRRDSSSSSDVVNPMELPPAVPLASKVPSFSFTAGLKVAQSALTPPSLPTSVAMVANSSSTFSFSTPKPLRSDSTTTANQQARPLPFSFSVPKNCSTTTTAKLHPLVPLPSPPAVHPKAKLTEGKPLPPLQSISVEQILKTPEFQLEGKKANVGKGMTATVNEVIDLTEEDEQHTKDPPPPPLQPLPQFTPVHGSWSCDTCMVSNKPSDGKCVACGELKPGSQNPSGLVKNQEASKLPDAGVQFGSFGGIKLGGSGLKFPSNSVGLPGLKLPTSSGAGSQMPAGSTGIQLGSATGCKKPSEPKSENETLKKFAPPTDSWTCDTCLVVNAPDRSMCVACSTPHAGSKKESSAREEPAKLTLGSSGGFKLGGAGGLVLGGFQQAAQQGNEQKASLKPLPQFAPPTNAWSCDVCMVSNKPEDSKCAACGTQKPGSDSGTKTGGAEVGSSGTAVQFGAQGGIKLSLGGGMNLLAGSSGGIQLGGKVLGDIELKKPVEQQEAKMAAPEMAPFKLGSGGLKLPVPAAVALGETKSNSSGAQKLTENQLLSQSTGSSVQPIFGTLAGAPATGPNLGLLPSGSSSLGVPAPVPAAKLPPGGLPPGGDQSTGGIKLGAPFQFSAPAVSESATTLASQLPTSSCLSSSSSTSSSSSFSLFKFGTSSQNTHPTSSTANPLTQIKFGMPSQVMNTTSAPQPPFAIPLAMGKTPSTQQNNPLPSFNFSAGSLKTQQQPIGMDAKPTFTFSAAKNSGSTLNTVSTSNSPFPMAGSASGAQGGFGGANLEQRPGTFSGLKFGVQQGNPQPQQALGSTSRAPIFGPTPTPQQQTPSQNLFTVLQQPQTATADQQPPKPASFNFHSTQATSGGATHSSNSAPSFSFVPRLGFGQPGNGGNSGGSLTGLTVPQGLGGSGAGATNFQFGGSNPTGGVFSAGGSTNQAKDSSVQNTGFNFSTGGGINFAGGTSTDSPMMFSADTSDSSTVSNRVIRKARRRKA